jgi:hypothetical protein
MREIGITVSHNYNSFSIKVSGESFDDCRKEIEDYLVKINFQPMAKAKAILNGQLVGV